MQGARSSDSVSRSGGREVEARAPEQVKELWRDRVVYHRRGKWAEARQGDTNSENGDAIVGLRRCS